METQRAQTVEHNLGAVELQPVETFDDYQRASRAFAYYSDNIGLLTTGLAEELVEIVSAITDPESPKEAVDELGDVLWYTAAYAFEGGYHLSEASRLYLKGLDFTVEHPEFDGSALDRFQELATLGSASDANPEVLAKEIAWKGILLIAAFPKRLRDLKGLTTIQSPKGHITLIDSLSSLLGTVAKTSDVLGLSMSQIAQHSIEKLTLRKAEKRLERRK